MENAISVNVTPDMPAMEAPKYLLFDAPAVAVAAVLGGPLGGCVAMALNYRRLDKPAAAAAAVTIGAAMTVLLVLLGYHVDARPAQAIGIVTLLLMRRIAKGLQGDHVDEHLRRCGRLASRWKAAGIGLASLAAIALVVFGFFFAFPE